MPLRHRIATIVLLTSTAASASPHTPQPDEKAKPALLKLRQELFQFRDSDIKDKELPRFKALCDAEGYPLVGNIMQKGDDDRMQPSKVCRMLNPKRKP
jgi:hypothetical protein